MCTCLVICIGSCLLVAGVKKFLTGCFDKWDFLVDEQTHDLTFSVGGTSLGQSKQTEGCWFHSESVYSTHHTGRSCWTTILSKQHHTVDIGSLKIVKAQHKFHTETKEKQTGWCVRARGHSTTYEECIGIIGPAVNQ